MHCLDPSARADSKGSLHTKVVLELRATTVAYQEENSNRFKGLENSIRYLTSREQELHSKALLESDDPTSLPENKPNDRSQLVDEKQRSSSPTCTPATLQDHADSMLSFSTVYRAQCKPACSCQCHFRQAPKSSAPFLRRVVGAFFLSYDVLPLLDPRRCNLANCRNSGNSVELQWFLPGWLCARILSITICRNFIVGRGASVSLEFPAVIRMSHPLYGPWRFNDFLELARVLERDKIRPYDVDGYGYSVLFVSPS